MLKDTNSLKKAIEIINKFSKMAGPKLNLGKTECLLTGSFIEIYANENSIHGVKINKNSVRSLGIYLGHNYKECYEKNWTSKLEKLERILSVWKRRNLTIFGKCTVVNTLAISKLVYNAFILSNPDNGFFKDVTKLIFNFLWKKKDRIKRNTLIGDIEEGGIGIVDIESKFLAAKASWISRILDERSITFRTLSDILDKTNISIYDALKTNDCNLGTSDFFIMTKLPHFYVEVITALNKCKKRRQVSHLKRDEFLTEFIWNNNLFTYKSKPLCFQNWIKSGILYVKDIFDADGNLYDINYFSNIIKKKNNIFCEYIMLRTCFKNYIDRFDCSYAKYINVQQNARFVFKDCLRRNTECLKSNFYYSILSVYENRWNKLFDVSAKIIWKNVYNEKIKCMYDKKIAEFNYKLLNCVLNNNLSVSKWNKDVSAECECCQTIEDCEHLLFSCKLVKHIWQEVGNFFNFEISWKILVLGFHYENNIKTRRLNNIMSFICFSIYKYKMSCRINQERMSKENLKYFVKNNLIVENCVLKKSGNITCTDNMYFNLSNYL